MDLQIELTGMYAKIRVKGPSGSPFGGGIVNILTQIIGVDPVLGVWKLKVEGGEESPTFGYFPTHSIESFMQVTEEEYVVQRDEIIKRYHKHEAECPDCKAAESQEDKWYGDEGKILEFLSKGEKEVEGNG